MGGVLGGGIGTEGLGPSLGVLGTRGGGRVGRGVGCVSKRGRVSTEHLLPNIHGVCQCLLGINWVSYTLMYVQVVAPTANSACVTCWQQ